MLKLNNADLDETLNFEILFPKYDFLVDMRGLMATDMIIQEQLTSLSDEKL